MSADAMHLLVGHHSHVGRVRERNEDSYLVLTPPAVAAPIDALLLVADGVGGANAGDVASGKLVEAIWSWFANNSYGEKVDFDTDHPDFLMVALKDLLELVNEHLFTLSQTHPEWQNMGTTATVGVLSNGRFFIAHAGDTRAYLLRQGALSQITVDHSWVAEEVAAGRLTAEEAKRHPRRNVIMRVLGNSLIFRTDRDVHLLQSEDVLIFTSDGLTGFVTDEEIRQSFLTHNYPQQACDELVSLANQRGGGDNITILAMRLYPSGDGFAPSNLPHGVAVSSAFLGYPVPPEPPAPNPISEADTTPVHPVARTQAAPAVSPAQVDTLKLPKAAPRPSPALADTQKVTKIEKPYKELVTQVITQEQLAEWDAKQAEAEEMPSTTVAPQPTLSTASSAAPSVSVAWLAFVLAGLVAAASVTLLALVVPGLQGLLLWITVLATVLVCLLAGFWVGYQTRQPTIPASLEKIE